MSKMSKLWYEARDAIDSEKYLKASNRTLRKYLAELSIVQPWESDQKCFHAAEKKHSMINKLKKEIERRKERNFALIRKFLWAIFVALIGGVVAGIVLLKIEYTVFQHKNQPNKEIKKTAPRQQQESIPIQPLRVTKPPLSEFWGFYTTDSCRYVMCANK